MEARIKAMIDSEDPKNPYTDEEIAKQLGIFREIVTEFRKNHEIPSSRERRRGLLLREAEEILYIHPNISDRNFTKILNERGYRIARYAAAKIKAEALEALQQGNKVNAPKAPKTAVEKVIDEEDPFRALIGYERSLRLQINQAKAAILYPPSGLHTLLLGPSGVGKSLMAELMHQFAKTTQNFSKDAPFMIFNCADYADNPQLLLSQLFGHSKGAFTGATESKKGIVELCHGGLLFLDEIHRLPPEGQEILFYLLDKGQYRRLGETEIARESRVMIIGATTENPESSLLLTFRRRIPMVIELPAISQRPYSERYYMIKNFFLQEYIRLKKDILVGADVIRCFMSYDCPGNIGQLKSDIQVCCARAFLQSTLTNLNRIKIRFQHIPDHVKDQALSFNQKDTELDKYTREDLVVSAKGVENQTEDYSNVGRDNIYQFIEERFKELKSDGYSDEEINKVIGQQVERQLIRFASMVNLSSTNQQELINIIGEKILDITQEIYQLTKKHIPAIQKEILYPLAIHLNSSYDRILNGREIVNPNLDMVKGSYEVEFKVAKKISMLLKDRLMVDFPEEETGFIAMYLKNFQQQLKPTEGRVGVIVLSHGRVATGMAEVVNRLLGVDFAVGLDMELSDSPDMMLEKAIKLVQRVNQGRGCILLVDMGSLTTFGDIITARTGIPTRVIGRVDTLMVLECARRALLREDTLDRIADEIDNKRGVVRGNGVQEKNLTRAIITLCITGEGSALKVKEYIESSILNTEKNIELIPLGYMNQEDILVTLDRIARNYQILAVIGTINPGWREVPFISMEDLIMGKAVKRLKKIIRRENHFKNTLPEVITSELIQPEAKHRYKNEVLDAMGQQLLERELVEDGFLLSLYKREAMGTTYLKGGIAIPHGESQYVTKPAIAVTKLANPIDWDGVNQVDIIFLIALKDDSKEYFEQLYRIIASQEALQRIRSAKSQEEIMAVLFKNTIPDK